MHMNKINSIFWKKKDDIEYKKTNGDQLISHILSLCFRTVQEQF